MSVRNRLRKKLGKLSLQDDVYDDGENPIYMLPSYMATNKFKADFTLLKKLVKDEKDSYEIKASPIHGMGLFASRNLPKGHAIVDYNYHVNDALKFDLLSFIDEKQDTKLNIDFKDIKTEWEKYQTESIEKCHITKSSYLFEICSEKDILQPNPDHPTKTKTLLAGVQRIAKPISKGEEILRHYGREWLFDAWFKYLLNLLPQEENEETDKIIDNIVQNDVVYRVIAMLQPDHLQKIIQSTYGLLRQCKCFTESCCNKWREKYFL